MKKVLIIVLILFFAFFVRTPEIEALTDISVISEVKVPDVEFNESVNTCNKILGTNLTKVLNASITAVQIISAIIAIVMGMIKLVPAIMSKDADGLKAASKSLVIMAIILALVFSLPSIIKLIGSIFKFDTSCFL